MTREMVAGGVLTPAMRAPGRREPLTGRQAAMVEYLRLTVGVQGYPPTMREIGMAVGLTSPSTVMYHLREIEAKGWIKRVPNQPRAIQIVEDDTVGADMVLAAADRFTAIRDVCEDPDWSAERKVARVLELLGGAA